MGLFLTEHSFSYKDKKNGEFSVQSQNPPADSKKKAAQSSQTEQP